MRERGWRTAVLACHAALAAAAASAALTLRAGLGARALVLGVGLLVLAAAAFGFVTGRRNGLAYGALVIVLGIGVAATEVVASADRWSFAALVMLIGLVELGLVLAWIRWRRSPR